MAIRPIEIITTQEAAQIKHMETQRAQHAQEQLSKNFQTMVKQEHEKTPQTTKAENMEYRYDAKEKGNNPYYGSGNKKKNKEKEEEKKKSNEPSKGGGFDILI
ncbi:MAG: hypothetical protein K0S01_3838 [Herbinix sp.]|jgi:hypothetical protein|nr:hypothetical protein [Herbinix sp.]